MLKAILFVCLLSLFSFGIPAENAQSARVIKDTGWVDVPADGILRPVDNVKVPTGGLVLASLDFRYAYEAENLAGPAVSGYQVGTRLEYHVGEAGILAQSNACGGELAAADGVNWNAHLPIPCAPMGDGTDWHVVPRAAAMPINLGVFQPGTHSISFAATQDVQEWGASFYPAPDPSFEVVSRYLQMRVRLTVVH